MLKRSTHLILLALLGATPSLLAPNLVEAQSRRSTGVRRPAARPYTVERSSDSAPPAPPAARALEDRGGSASRSVSGPEWHPSRTSASRSAGALTSYRQSEGPPHDAAATGYGPVEYGASGYAPPGYAPNRRAYGAPWAGPAMGRPMRAGFAGGPLGFGAPMGMGGPMPYDGDPGEQVFGPEFQGGPELMASRYPAGGPRYYPGYRGEPTLARRQPTYAPEGPITDTPSSGGVDGVEELPPGPQFEDGSAPGPDAGGTYYDDGVMPNWPSEPYPDSGFTQGDYGPGGMGVYGGYPGDSHDDGHYGWEAWPDGGTCGGGPCSGGWCGGGPNACGSCYGCCGYWGVLGWLGHWWYNWCWYKDLSLFAGMHGFKGPVDQGVNSNFGFQEGFNLGGPIWYSSGIGFQVGMQAVQSDLSGYDVVGPTSSSRHQYFLTAGIFRRVRGLGPRGGGFQWGVVGDYLSDSYYVDQQLGQVRAEFSMISPYNHELGFWGAFGGDQQTAYYNATPTVRRVEIWKPQSLYAFFYRRTFLNCGQGRVWGGFTENGDGLVGSDLRMPLSSALAFEWSANYLIPSESALEGGMEEEAWNVSGNLVWYIGCTARQSYRSRWRPLFTVADNSVFMLERLAGSGAVAP